MKSGSTKDAKDVILDTLRKTNKRIGNSRFIEIFKSHGLTQRDYEHARAELLQSRLIVHKQGRGGAVDLANRTNSALLPPADVQSETLGVRNTQTGVRDTKDLILKRIPKEGTIGNIALIKLLSKEDVKEDLYWLARNELIKEGRLVRGRGKGGSISLAEELEKKLPPPKSQERFKKEKDLYAPFERTVRDYWIKDNNIDARRCVVETTANQGSRRTGGKWTRPDVTIVAINTFTFIPGKSLDIITFEIKPSNDLDIVGVYETASHSRFAVRSYLAVHLPNGITPPIEQQIEQVSKECDRFGVGFLHFKDPSDPETWVTILEPTRKSPDPAESDSFLSVQISKRNQDEIQKML